MTTSLAGPVSSIPPRASGRVVRERGGETAPTGMSRELGLAFMAAHVAWARRYAPHLLREWENQ